MTAAWVAGKTYVPGSLVRPASAPPVTQTQAVNGYFEEGATGWDFSGSCALATSGGYGSPNCCIAPGSTAGGEALNQAHFSAPAGAIIKASCMIQQGASDVDHTRGYVLIHFYRANNTEIGTPAKGNVVNDGRGGAWHASNVTATAPAETAYARAGIYLYQNSADPIWGDNLVVSSAYQTPSGLVYKAVQANPGKSADSEPTWPLTLGVQVIDNEVTWEAVQATRITWEASPVMRSGTTEPNWPTAPGGMVHDGDMDWIAVSSQITDPNCPHSKVVAIMASKVFAADKDIVRFSATVNPLDWSSAQDAGYLPTGLQQANSNDMAVLAPYRSNLTTFNASSFQNWQVDPDPSAMSLLDQLESIGSTWQHAAQPVGNDLFYLSQLGVRSVGIAAGTDNLAAGDIGMPVDVLVRESIRVATANETPVLATYYPSAGQYWLAVRALQPLAITGHLPNGPIGEVVNYQYTVSGGVLPRVVSIASGALPAGLSINASGLVTGTRTTYGNTTWTLKAVDANGAQVQLDDANLTTKPATLDPASLGNDGGTGGVIASDNLTITKNTDPNGFSIGARVFVSDAKTAGKWYFEATVLVAATRAENRGIDVGLERASNFGQNQRTSIGSGTLELSSEGSFWQNGASNPSGGPAYNVAGATVGIAVDVTTGKWWWRNASGWNPGGDPAAGINPKGTLTATAMSGGVAPFVTAYASNGSIRANFGNAPFVLGDVPEGFNPGWGLFA